MGDVAEALQSEYAQLLGVDGREMYNGMYESPYVTSAGDFSIDVLARAVKETCGFQLIRLSHPSMASVKTSPQRAEGFICNKDDHWFAIRKLGSKFWRLDSMKNVPEVLVLRVLIQLILIDGPCFLSVDWGTILKCIS